MSRPDFNDDFVDLLRALVEARVEFVVAAHALAAHGVPRATGDLDVFVRPSVENAARVIAALGAFGAPLIGLPRRIDLLTSISGVSFEKAWGTRLDDDTLERNERKAE